MARSSETQLQVYDVHGGVGLSARVRGHDALIRERGRLGDNETDDDDADDAIATAAAAGASPAASSAAAALTAAGAKRRYDSYRALVRLEGSGARGHA